MVIQFLLSFPYPSLSKMYGNPTALNEGNKSQTRALLPLRLAEAFICVISSAALATVVSLRACEAISRLSCQGPLWGLRACEAISLLSVCLRRKCEIATFLAMTGGLTTEIASSLAMTHRSEIAIPRGHIALRSQHQKGALTRNARAP